MLTVFATPKPFRGHIAVIQRNAIRSWTLLRPACEIILLGDEEGIADTAAEFGLPPFPFVFPNNLCPPLVNELVKPSPATRQWKFLLLCDRQYFFKSHLIPAVQRIVEQKT